MLFTECKVKQAMGRAEINFPRFTHWQYNRLFGIYKAEMAKLCRSFSIV
jgi:hypothetical protein